MATINLATNFNGAQIARIATNLKTAVASYGTLERKFASLTVDDTNGNVVFTGPDGTSRTLTI